MFTQLKRECLRKEPVWATLYPITVTLTNEKQSPGGLERLWPRPTGRSIGVSRHRPRADHYLPDRFGTKVVYTAAYSSFHALYSIWYVYGDVVETLAMPAAGVVGIRADSPFHFPSISLSLSFSFSLYFLRSRQKIKQQFYRTLNARCKVLGVGAVIKLIIIAQFHLGKLPNKISG